MKHLALNAMLVLTVVGLASACPLCAPDGRPELVIILDRSGSMESMKQDMEGGLKTYLDGLKPPELNMTEFVRKHIQEDGVGPKYARIPNVTLAQFDDKYELVHEGVWLPLILDPVIEPRGRTALLDAVGKTLESVAARQKQHPPTKTIVVIITDGLENASTEYTRDQVLSLIEHYRTVHRWEFVFLGANQDAFAEASSLGIEWSIDIGHYSMSDTVFVLTSASNNYFADGNFVLADPNGSDPND